MAQSVLPRTVTLPPSELHRLEDENASLTLRSTAQQQLIESMRLELEASDREKQEIKADLALLAERGEHSLRNLSRERDALLAQLAEARIIMHHDEQELARLNEAVARLQNQPHSLDAAVGMRKELEHVTQQNRALLDQQRDLKRDLAEALRVADRYAHQLQTVEARRFVEAQTPASSSQVNLDSMRHELDTVRNELAEEKRRAKVEADGLREHLRTRDLATANHQREVEALLLGKSELEREIVTLQQRLNGMADAARSQQSEWERSRVASEDQIHKLRRDLAEALRVGEQRLLEQSRILNERQREVGALQEELKSARQQLSSSTSEVRRIQGELTATKQAAERDHASFLREISGAKDRQEKIQSQFDSTKRQLDVSHAEMHALKRDLSETLRASEQSHFEKKRLQDEIERERKSHDQTVEALRESAAKLERSMSVQLAEIELLKQEAASSLRLGEELAREREEKGRCLQQLEEVKSERDAIQRQMLSMKHDLDHAVAQGQHHLEELRSARSECDGIRREKEEMERSLRSEHQNEIWKLRQSVHSSSVMMTLDSAKASPIASDVGTETLALRREIRQLNDRIHELDLEKRRIKDALEGQKTDLLLQTQALKAELAQKDADWELKLKRITKSLEEAASAERSQDARRFRDMLANVTSELDEERRKSRASQQASVAAGENDSKRERIDVEEEISQRLERQRKRLVGEQEEEKTRWQRILKDLEVELEQARREIHRLKSAVSEAEAEQVRLQRSSHASILQLQAELDRSNAESSSKRKLFSEEDSSSSKIEDLSRQLMEAKRALGAALMKQKEVSQSESLQLVISQQEADLRHLRSELETLQRREQERSYYGQKSEADLAALQKESASRAAECSVLRQHVVDLEKRLSLEDGVRHDLEVALAEAQQAIRDWQRRCKALVSSTDAESSVESSSLKSAQKIQALQADYDAQRERLLALEREIERLRIERTEISAQSTHAQEILQGERDLLLASTQKMQSQLAEMQSTIDHLLREKHTLSTEKDQLAVQMVRLEGELKTLATLQHSLKEASQPLIQQPPMDETMEMLHDLQDMNRKLVEQLEAAEVRARECEDLLTQRDIQCKAWLLEKDQQIEALKANTPHLFDGHEALMDRLVEKEREVAAFLREKMDLLQREAEQQKSIESLMARLASYESQTEMLRAGLAKQVIQSQDRLQEAEIRFQEELTRVRQDAEANLKRLDAHFQARIEIADSERKRLEEQVAYLTAEADSNNQSEDFQEAVLQERVRALEAENGSVRVESLRQLQILELKVQTLQQELDKRDSLLQQATKGCDIVEPDISSLKLRIDLLEEEKVELHKELSGFKSNLEIVRERIREMEIENATLRESITEAEGAQLRVVGGAMDASLLLNASLNETIAAESRAEIVGLLNRERRTEQELRDLIQHLQRRLLSAESSLFLMQKK